MVKHYNPIRYTLVDIASGFRSLRTKLGAFSLNQPVNSTLNIPYWSSFKAKIFRWNMILSYNNIVGISFYSITMLYKMSFKKCSRSCCVCFLFFLQIINRYMPRRPWNPSSGCTLFLPFPLLTRSELDPLV